MKKLLFLLLIAGCASEPVEPVKPKCVGKCNLSCVMMTRSIPPTFAGHDVNCRCCRFCHCWDYK